MRSRATCRLTALHYLIAVTQVLRCCCDCWLSRTYMSHENIHFAYARPQYHGNVQVGMLQRLVPSLCTCACRS